MYEKCTLLKPATFGYSNHAMLCQQKYSATLQPIYKTKEEREYV